MNDDAPVAAVSSQWSFHGNKLQRPYLCAFFWRRLFTSHRDVTTNYAFAIHGYHSVKRSSPTGLSRGCLVYVYNPMPASLCHDRMPYRLVVMEFVHRSPSPFLPLTRVINYTFTLLGPKVLALDFNASGICWFVVGASSCMCSLVAKVRRGG